MTPLPPAAADLLRVLVLLLAIVALDVADVLVHSRMVRFLPLPKAAVMRKRK